MYLSRIVVPAFLATLICCQAAQAREVIRINGTGCGMALMMPLIAAFQKTRKDVRFEVQKSLGSAASLKAIARDALDVAVPGRALKAHEMADQLAWYEYGKTPYAVLTHRNAAVDNLTTGQFAAMYDGTLARWPNGDFVRVILRPEDDIDTKVLRGMSPEMDKAVTAAHARKDMLLGITDQESFDHLKKTSGSIGFVPLTMALSEPGSVNVSRLNGVQPTLANLSAGKYPYAKTIFVVTKKDASPAVRAFVEFLNSKKTRAMAARYGVLPSAAK